MTKKQQRQLRTLLDRLLVWRGAPTNGHLEEGYVDLVIAVSDDLAVLLGVSEEECLAIQDGVSPSLFTPTEEGF